MPTKFQNKVYNICKKVPKGKVTTYLWIAKKLKNSPRAVGNALNKNPYGYSAISSEAIRKSGSVIRGDLKRNSGFFLVPCHRVIKSTGEIGGFASGTRNKINLLRKEGIRIKNNEVDLKKYGFNLN